MTPAERMDALINGQPIDRVPFFPFAHGFCARNVGYAVATVYNDPEKSFWAQVWTQEQYGCDGYPFYFFCNSEGWDFGGEIKFPSSDYEQAPVITRFPVESEEDVERLKLPDVKTSGSIPIMMAFSKLQKRYGLPVTWVFGDPFSAASTMCGVDRLCRWVIKKPKLVHRLCRLATEHIANISQYWVDTFGSERLLPFAWNGVGGNDILSVKQFEEFGLPYMKELHKRILAMGVKHIFCHICGEQNSNLPYLSQVPMGDPGITSFGHQVDLTTAIKYFGDTCIIAGNVEPAVIQTGTPQQVYELSKQAILKAKYAAPRGYMLMAGCEVPPMTPPYNFYMMKKAINDFGWYK